jgi:ketosteroid isomerase-like protein
MVEDEVRQASERFYEALNRLFVGDAGPVLDVWSHAPDVVQLGPFGGRRTGWDQVRDEFEKTARQTSGGRIEAVGLEVHTVGDLAYTTSRVVGENVDRQGRHIPVDHRETCIYRREDGEWKMIYHHADVAPGLQRMMGGEAGARA